MASSLSRLLRRGVVAALIAFLPLSAFALTPADVAPLGADDFDAKSAAIDKLIATHDAPSLVMLKALSEGNALATDAGEVLIQDGDTQRDARDRQARDGTRRPTRHAEQPAALEGRGCAVRPATRFRPIPPCDAPRSPGC